MVSAYGLRCLNQLDRRLCTASMTVEKRAIWSLLSWFDPFPDDAALLGAQPVRSSPSRRRKIGALVIRNLIMTLSKMEGRRGA